MAQGRTQEITITGRFVFTPFSAVSLAEAICASGRVLNKEQLLSALWWPKTLLEREAFSWSLPNADEVLDRNDMRSASRHLHWAIAPEKQGGEVALDYVLFSYGRSFCERHGYHEAMRVVEEQGYMSPKTAWFLSFVLQIPKENLSHPGIASPVSIDTEKQSLYPYYSPSRSGSGGGKLWFECNSGDTFSEDADLFYMNHGLMLGVRPRT